MNQEITIIAILATTVLTGIVHTLAGPDHYLPFIAISKSRNYGIFKTLLWTVICGLGHVGSTILLVVAFLLFSELFTSARVEWLEAWRGNIAAYAMIGTGTAMLIYSLHKRWKKRPYAHKHVHSDGSVTCHTHTHDQLHNSENLSYWVIFIIFVLGPCEALLPLLTASAVLGTADVILVSVVFSITTISTMCAAVIAGRFGLKMLHFAWMEKFAPEIAGATVMLCGLAIICFGL